MTSRNFYLQKEEDEQMEEQRKCSLVNVDVTEFYNNVILVGIRQSKTLPFHPDLNCLEFILIDVRPASNFSEDHVATAQRNAATFCSNASSSRPSSPLDYHLGEERFSDDCGFEGLHKGSCFVDLFHTNLAYGN